MPRCPSSWKASSDHGTLYTSGFDATNYDSVDRLNSLAAYLHSAYTGFETILSRISKEAGGVVEKGKGAWHFELLDRFTAGQASSGFPIFDLTLREKLDDLRAFRHVFRNHYSHELEWEKIAPVASHASATLHSALSALWSSLAFPEEIQDDGA